MSMKQVQWNRAMIELTYEIFLWTVTYTYFFNDFDDQSQGHHLPGSIEGKLMYVYICNWHHVPTLTFVAKVYFIAVF